SSTTKSTCLIGFIRIGGLGKVVVGIQVALILIVLLLIIWTNLTNYRLMYIQTELP
ncbi:unnamed protein product, partial [marine sediment metagenome]